MIVNREFFFRGWLPAGLVINARLLSKSSSHNEATMVPILNPVPGSHWPVEQPAPVFPVTQATDQVAILLKDPMPETAIVMLPLKQWFGSGTPYILAFNTWYEGRVQEVTGSDVMSIRIPMSVNREYYSYYSGLDAKDVKLNVLPCTTIPGRQRADCLMLEDGSLNHYESGFPPTVSVEGNSMFGHIMEPLNIQGIYIAGMMSAFSELSPGAERHFIQCQVTDGAKKIPASTKYVGLGTKVDAGVRPFYTAEEYALTALAAADALDKQGKYYSASPFQTGESVVHYN